MKLCRFVVCVILHCVDRACNSSNRSSHNTEDRMMKGSGWGSRMSTMTEHTSTYFSFHHIPLVSFVFYQDVCIFDFRSFLFIL